MERQHDRSQLDKELQIETQDVHWKPNCLNKGSHKYQSVELCQHQGQPSRSRNEGTYSNRDDKKSLWLQGLEFLLSFRDNWTTDEQQNENVFINSAESNLQETRQQPIDKDLIDANKFSHWLKLRADVIKMKNLRNKTRTRDHQIKDAENFLFRISQQQSFDENINQLTHINPFQKRSRLL